LSQVLLPKREDNDQKRYLLYYPCFQTENELADQINRIRWYLPKQINYQIILPVTNELRRIKIESLKQPAFHRRIEEKGILDHVTLIDGKTVNSFIRKSKIVCVWKINRIWDLARFMDVLLKIRIVDPDFFLFAETHTYPAIYYYDLLPNKTRKDWRNESSDRFGVLYQRFSGAKKAFVFGTGPSINKAKGFSYNDGIRIICNSVVKNEELLKRIQPHFLVFTDSVFHFGVSKYSGDFAKDLLKAVKKYNTICITNQVGYAMMRLHFPELIPFLIAVPAKRFGPPNLLTPEKFLTRDYTNVLTRFMFPLAAGLSKNVVLLGFDGRNPQETYFWKHNPTTQYSENLDSTKLSHPAFFRDISYDNYYEKHCKALNTMIIRFEKYGVKAYTWTESYIPSLQSRFFEGTKS
jgi:hypothetical protein